MSDFLDVSRAASELGVNKSRVRALIASGELDAEKLGGRWLLDRMTVIQRGRKAPPPGRPLASHNAWLLILAASGEELPDGVTAVVRWRIRQGLSLHGLAGMRGRLERRGRVHHLWALPGELRVLHRDRELWLTGSSAAGALGLRLLGPDTLDAYIPSRRLRSVIDEHALETVPSAQANVILREVPDDAWLPGERRVAPAAAVALDLADYPDPRSARAGTKLIAKLDSDRERDDS